MKPQRRSRRRESFARSRLWPRVLILTLACLASRAFAQPEPPRPAPNPPAATPDEAPATAPAAPPVQLVPEDDIPDYHFSPLKVTGRVDRDGKVARLRAEIEVHINHPLGCFDVPLRLSQASITGMHYEGPQEPIPVPPTAQDDGVHWLFEGAGRHLLTLDLVVELRTVSGGTNLQLTLPSGSRFFPTQVELTVPLTPLTVEAGKDHVIEQAAPAAGETLIRATLAGNRIDLTWRSPQERRGTITRALTSIALDASEDRLRLQATQDLSTDGLVNDVRVRLPTGFRLVSLSGRDYASHAPSETDPAWVDVRLAPRERTEVQLDWWLESASPLQPGTLTIDGFDVQGAYSQSGTIGAAPLPGYKLYRLSTEADDGIHREETRRLRPARGVPQFKWAWRFDRQPLELALDVQEERPAFDVRTRAVATAEADLMVLNLDFLVQVHAGRPQEFLLRWPSPGSDGWTLQQAPEGVVVADATDERSQFLGEYQRITLPAPREGEFSLSLQFQRPSTPGRFEFGLPTLEADRTLAAWLILRGVDSIAPRVDENSRLSALGDSAADPWLRAQAFDADSDQAYRLEDPHTTVSGALDLFPRKVLVDSVVSIDRTTATALRIEQTLNLDVRYGRVEDVVLAWPDSFPVEWRAPGAAAVQCRLSSGQPVPLESDGVRLHARLPEARSGHVSLSIAYRLPLDAGADRIAVPVFTPVDSAEHTVRVELPDSGSLQAEPVGDVWRRVVTALRPTWIAVQDAAVFEALLSADVGSAPQRYQVDTAFAQVQFDASGRSRTLVEYALRGAPARIVLELPAEAEQIDARWNGATPAEALQAEPVDGGQRIEIQTRSDEDRADGRLQLTYQLSVAAAMGDGRDVPVPLPALPESVSIGTTVVELVFPGDHSLLTYPPGWTPLFEWRPGLVFQREPTAAYLEWRKEFLGPDGAAGDDLRPGERVTAGRAYPFWMTGGTAAVSFRTIRMWALILAGSGLTLAAAFLLWSVHALRNVLTLLAIAVAVAVAGVFASEVIELLLQPVLLGLLAAVIAISLQVQRPAPVVRRREDPSTRSEQPPSNSRISGSYAPGQMIASTQAGPREMQESGSRP